MSEHWICCPFVYILVNLHHDTSWSLILKKMSECDDKPRSEVIGSTFINIISKQIYGLFKLDGHQRSWHQWKVWILPSVAGCGTDLWQKNSLTSATNWVNAVQGPWGGVMNKNKLDSVRISSYPINVFVLIYIPNTYTVHLQYVLTCPRKHTCRGFSSLLAESSTYLPLLSQAPSWNLEINSAIKLTKRRVKETQ